MFFNGEMHIQTSKVLLLDKLFDYSRIPFSRIETKAGSFKLYDAISKRNWRLYHYFVIKGRVFENENVIIIKYSIMPVLTSWVSMCIMLFSMFFLLSMGESSEIGKWMCLISVAANICYIVDLIWQAHVVKKRFEKKLHL